MDRGGMGRFQTEANVSVLSVGCGREGILIGNVDSWGQVRAKGCCSRLEDWG